MSPRVSIRAQLVVGLTAALSIGLALATIAGVGILNRTSGAERRAALERSGSLLVASLQEACGKDRACLESHVAALADQKPAVRLVDATAPVPPGSVSLPLGAEAMLQLSAPSPGPVAASAGTLLFAYLALVALLVLVFAVILLNRVISRPLDQLALAAERIGRMDLDQPFQEGPPSLGRLGTAFERMALNLKDERARVASQIQELKALNRELTEARESLVRSEKLATVGRLAAGVAHEVGNPLGAIVGYVELARGRAKKGSDVTELLDCVAREVGRIDRTVRELLDYSRPAPQVLGPVPLREAVEAAVRLASVQQRLKGVEFELDVPLGFSVLAESHHLSQVLVNLLLNAGDAMDGNGRIRLSARSADGRAATEEARVVLEVRDSGPGIREADLARIFDPFFTTKDPGEGTGLGLSICHRLMETFGGEIHASNGDGGGAVFTLVFRPPLSSSSPSEAGAV